MPKLDLDTIPQTNSTGYPEEHAGQVAGRWFLRLSPPSGLTRFGASHVVLKPGAWSSQRHWHEAEDELLVMLTGEAVLFEDEGPVILRAGDIAAFPQGVRNGHHLRNESDADCSFLVVGAGDRSAGGAYSDIDMIFTGEGYFHRDGTPYDTTRLP